MLHYFSLQNRIKSIALTAILSLPFVATAQQGMRVGSNAAPSEVLHVDGAILLGSTTNTNAGAIRWNGTDFQGYNGTTWVSLNSQGALYTAGAGLTLTGTVFSHNTQTPIDVNATDNGTNVVDRVVVDNLGHVSSVVARDLSAATTSAAGVMSAADKVKLDGIAAGATANLGTVTSVAALTLGTSGTDLSSTVATGTTTPVITLNVPTASAANRGALSAADWSTFNAKESPLTFSTGLTRTANTITNNLSTGVAGGQTAIGGTAAGNDLSLSSTANATKGKILVGTSAYDEVNNRLGIGNSAPSFPFDVKGLGVNQGPITTSDNILGRFEQSTAATGAGIQIKGFRNTSGNVSSFIDLMNYGTPNNDYIVARVAAERGAGEAGSLLFYTNSGSGIAERMRINQTGAVTINALGGSGTKLVQTDNLGNISASALSLSGINTGDQTITLTGDVTGSGTGSFATTLATVATAGTNTKVTYSAKGLVTSGSTPTTFAGYSIAESSAGLAGALSDETGSGAAVFGTSPTFTGIPVAPTAAANTNTTQLATTAFVAGNFVDLLNTQSAAGAKTWTGSQTYSDNTPFQFTNTGTGTYNRAVMYNNASGITFERSRVSDASNAAIMDFQINQRGGGTPALIVKGSGNVGINNASPSYTLHVTGTIAGTGGDLTTPYISQVHAIGLTQHHDGNSGATTNYHHQLVLGDNGAWAGNYSRLYLRRPDNTYDNDIRVKYADATISSRELKTNIIPVTQAYQAELFESLLAAEVVHYEWKNDPDHAIGFKHLGLIAQDAPKEMQTVGKDGLELGDFIGLSIASFKQLKLENDLLKARIEALEKLLLK